MGSTEQVKHLTLVAKTSLLSSITIEQSYMQMPSWLDRYHVFDQGFYSASPFYSAAPWQ